MRARANIVPVGFSHAVLKGPWQTVHDYAADVDAKELPVEHVQGDEKNLLAAVFRRHGHRLDPNRENGIADEAPRSAAR